jgi:hypothetical protein
MGWTASFIGVKGVERTRVLEVLGVAETGVVVEPYDADLAWGETAQRWLILASKDYGFASPARLAELSVGGEAVSCQVEEHVMASGARGFRDGVEVWSIEYDCEKSRDVDASGALPEAFAGVHEKARQNQAGEEENVDYIWDVPADVFAALTGYRYDFDTSVELTELRLPGTVKAETARGGGLASVLAKLFGKK